MASSPSQTNPNSFHTDFCLQLAYKVLQKQIQNGSNFVSSPLSLHIILSLVAAGAKGKTLEELLSFLGSPSKDDLNSASSQIVSSLRNVEGTENGGPSLSFVNGAWVDKTFGLKASFEELVKNVYRSPIEEVDFRNKAEEVAEEVNSWTESETNGLIRELLPPDSITADTVLVLANALYFKGAWNSKKFDPTMTETKNFHLLNGGNVQVPFMTSMPYEEYYYRSFNNYKVLAIPYHQSGRTPLKFIMYFFLPHEKDGLPDLIHTLNSNARCLNEEIELWSNEVDHVWIPRFKFSFNLDAIEDLKELGLTLPFKVPGDLTEIADCSYGHRILVSKIVQKAFVEVNEEGTEAAASTDAILDVQFSAGLPSPPKPKPKLFVADHPFLFMIREETSLAVFFIGAVLNPILDS
ncbi:hypothetical protein QN277_016064 [Acacia crassicarpa]|uniref:Serpin domain-containing protein n=1 Tax=Acacia crassicarpa TaxID=499986 RepID=A0AAE1MVV1_9FABA|nr:hypothetical protein QN277_016064 [Acacia crassicarpa]